MKLHTSFHYIRWKEGSGGSRTSPLTSSTSPLSAMSDNRISTKGCWRLNAAPHRLLQRDNLFDRREVTLAERVVLLAKKTLPLARYAGSHPFEGLSLLKVFHWLGHVQ
jgi:hypothetical protein